MRASRALFSAFPAFSAFSAPGLFAFCLLLLCLLPPRTGADPLGDLAGPERAARLRAGETLTEVQLKNPSFRLLPEHLGAGALALGIQGDLAPGVMAETLSLYKKPPASAGRAWTEEEKTRLFNAALGISSLAGIEYYSASRGKMRTFYETSTVIDGPESKKPLPDPSCAAPPAAMSLYARQKDLTFGDNLYRYDYYALEGAFAFVQENLSVMNAGILPAVGKNKLRSLVAVLDAGDYLLLYMCSMARAVSLPGLGTRIGNSFSNRAQAILRWYSARADSALGAR